MNKILLIARREFLSRVQKKTFLLTTILLPLLIFGFYALTIYFSVSSDEKYNIAVADEAHLFRGNIDQDKDVHFDFVHNETPSTLKAKVEKGNYDGYMFIPAGKLINTTDSIHIYTKKGIGLMDREKIRSQLNHTLEEKRLMNLNITKLQLDSIRQDSNINFSTINSDEDEGSEEGVSYAVGYISGFLIYIILFIYGSMVMRGVMEEKVNRIAEVIVSSVKPYQLMMGKIFGIGAVGLVQFMIWIVLMFSLNFLLPVIFPGLISHMNDQATMQSGAVQAVNTIQQHGLLGNVHFNFALILFCFVFYFLGGYLLYSALFASVGSAVNEDPQDAQSLMLPITMPIIFSIVIMTKAVNDPNGGLSVFGSLFPLTSPVVMMARVAHGVPDGVSVWQLLLSMVLLILGFLGTTWLAAKIYRTGILMYGKKPTWKEMWKWAVRKG